MPNATSRHWATSTPSPQSPRKGKRTAPDIWWKASTVTWTLPEPMLSTPVPEPDLRPGCVAEPKWDGFRALLSVDSGRVVLRSRRGTEMAPAFPEVVAGAAQLPDATALDGVMWPVRVSQPQGVSGGAPPRRDTFVADGSGS